MIDINNSSLYKVTRKNKYQIHCYMPVLGTKVFNKFEKSSYVTDKNKPIVLVGTQGEEWIVDLGKLCKTYTFADGSAITPEALKSKIKPDGTIDKLPIVTSAGGTNFALQVPVKYKCSLPTAWGDVLQVNAPDVSHGDGDYIVCAADEAGKPMLNDRWVVNGLIFQDTYDMGSFAK